MVEMNSLINFREENNCLYISLTENGKEAIDDIINNDSDFNSKWCDLIEYERCNGYFDFILPEELGALTTAPIIGFDVCRDEDYNIEGIESTRYYWLSNYCLINEFEILKSGEEIILHKIPE